MNTTKLRSKRVLAATAVVAALAADPDADTDDVVPTRLTDDLGFTDEERSMPIDKLYRRCKVWSRMAERESRELEQEWRELERQYKAEWLEKEVLLDQVINSELDWNKRRQAVTASAADTEQELPALAQEGEVHPEGKALAVEDNDQ